MSPFLWWDQDHVQYVLNRRPRILECERGNHAPREKNKQLKWHIAADAAALEILLLAHCVSLSSYFVPRVLPRLRVHWACLGRLPL